MNDLREEDVDVLLEVGFGSGLLENLVEIDEFGENEVNIFNVKSFIDDFNENDGDENDSNEDDDYEDNFVEKQLLDDSNENDLYDDVSFYDGNSDENDDY